MISLYHIIDSIWAWIAERTFVRFDFDMPTTRIRAESDHKSILFSLTAGGLVEWLILSSWCRREGLGPILITNRLGLLFLGKPLLALAIVFRKRSWVSAFVGEDTQGPRLIFCKQGERRKLFEPAGVEALLADIERMRLSHGRPPRSISVIPVLITWRKYLRGAGRNLSELLFGLSSSPNIVGKIWYLIRRRKDSMVKGLEPFLLGDRPGSEDVLGEDEPLRIAKSVRRKILIAVNEEMRVMLGPRYVSPTAVKETLLHDVDIRIALEAAVREEGLPKQKLMLRAYRILTEIVANYSYRFIEIMYVGLTWLFTRVFDGLDSREDELDRLRETLKQKPIVFVSAHRSHLDYLVIPYVLFLQDIVTPHIAAGINLAFWPIGSLLRRGGAFFIRRSFRGDKLYSLLLKKYVSFLIQNRFNIMFFIEGTRSRTGKLLPPTYGFLKMILDSFHNRICEDLALIPVSISYDEVIEQSTYARELVGAQKEKEDARALLRSRRITRKNIGKVYVRLGEPVSVKEVFREAGILNLGEKIILQKTAFDLCTRINKSTPITPKSILSTIVLGQSSPITLERLVTVGQKLQEHALALGNQLIAVDVSVSRRAIESLLRQFHRQGIIRSVEGALPMAFEVPREKRAALVFYRNNAIHCFVLPALAVLSLELVRARSVEEPCHDEVIRMALTLRNLFKFDFFFAPTREFVNDLSSLIALLADEGGWQIWSAAKLVDRIEQCQGGSPGLMVYRALLADLVESYVTVAETVKSEFSQRTEKKAFLQRLLKYGQQKLSDNRLVYPESISLLSYGSALSLLENLGAIALTREGEKTWVEARSWDSKAETALELLRKVSALSEV